MDPAYGQGYRQLYERHWWWRARERFVLDQIRAYRSASDTRALLDIGCGDALFFPELRRFGPVYGIESEAALLDDGNPDCDKVHVGFLDAGYSPPEPVSTVLLLDVVEHMHDPLTALRHLRSIVEPDARVIITVPALMQLWTAHDELNHHVTRFSRAALRGLLEEAGFEVIASRYFFRWLVAPKLLVRLLEATRGKNLEPPQVPHPLVNRLCLLLSRMEERVAGRLPASVPGSSLLAIARPAT